MTTINEDLVQRLEAAITRLEKLSGGKSTSTSTASAEEVPAAVVGYDEFLSSVGTPFCNLTSSLMPELKEGGELLLEGFKAVRLIVLAAAKGQKPKTEGMKALLAPVVKVLEQIEKKRADSKGTVAWEHYSALNEASKCLQWVGVRDITVKYVKETVGAAQFYTMKILREYRTKDERHVQWVNDLKNTVEKLAAYVSEYHMTGLRFNAKGEKEAQLVLDDIQRGGTTNAAPKAGGAPPPPPAGPPPPLPPKDNRGSSEPPMGAVFDEIRQFSTTGLRKVTADMKTKNRPAEERRSVVPASTPKSAPVKKVVTNTKTEPPRIELIGDKKWEISNQINNQDIELEEDQLKMFHAVYIYNCEDSLIQIHGKVNSISLDNCKKTSLIFGSTVASVELVNCESCKVQAKGSVPMISLNKTDGAQVFLSKESATCPIYSSKSSEMNLCIANDEDYDELPLPELFVTRFDPKTKQLSTAPEEV